MPSKVQDAELSQAVFRAIQEGSYPEDEQIVAAELPPSALNSLSELLEQARADVKVFLGTLSTVFRLLTMHLGKYQRAQQVERLRHRWLDTSSKTTSR